MKVNYQILSLVLILVIGYLLINKGSSVDTKEAAINNMMTRTSVRAYTPEPIDDESLELIVKAAMSAPTAGNMQPWEFIIITDKKVMEAYSQINTHSEMAKTAAAAIVVLANMDTYKDRPHMRGYWPQDTSAATQNLLLAAHAMGLGAVWTGIYSEETSYAGERLVKISELLKLPANKIPLALVFLGHPDGEQLPKDKWKPEKVTWMK